MNLFENPSLKELYNLLSRSDRSLRVHNIVVDYDGEVLVDPQLKQPNLDLSRFKCCFKFADRKAIRRESARLRSLLRHLLVAWETNFELAAN